MATENEEESFGLRERLKWATPRMLELLTRDRPDLFRQVPDNMKMTIAQIQKASKETLAAELSNRVYAAAVFLEKTEDAGRIVGNGHHMAQAVAKCAEDKMKEAWLK